MLYTIGREFSKIGNSLLHFEFELNFNFVGLYVVNFKSSLLTNKTCTLVRCRASTTRSFLHAPRAELSNYCRSAGTSDRKW